MTNLRWSWHPDSRDLLGYLLSMAATDERNIAYWRAYVAIWDKSLRDPEIAAELNSWISAVLKRVETFIAVLNPQCADKSTIARRLLAQMQGISIQRLFDPASWSDQATREAFTSEIDLLVHKNPSG